MLLYKPYALKVRLVCTRCAVEKALKKTAPFSREPSLQMYHYLGIMPVILLLSQ